MRLAQVAAPKPMASRSARSALAAVVLATLLAPGASARLGMPEPLTERGRVVEGIYFQIALAGLVVFVLVFALLMWILLRYREGTGKGRSTHEAHRGSLRAELVWTLIPLGVMLWIGVISYAGLVDLDSGVGGDDYAMEVKVTGYQWFWQMDYGAGVTVFVNPSADAATGAMTYSDTFHLPANTPVLLNLTGGDVIHAFNILDENRAYVTMDDANPAGPHKYLRKVVTLPVGTYTIQCKEMCLNPGHGYMRAQLVVERKASFDQWRADRALFGDAGLREFVDVTADDGKLAYGDPAPPVVVAGTRVGIKLHNDGSQPVTVTLDGASPVEVLAGDVARLAFDAEGGKSYNVSVNPGGSFVVQAITPDATIEVRFTDGADGFRIVPADVTMEIGKGYLIRATNTGGTGHNLFIGTYGGEVLANSNNAGPGEVALVYFKPTAAGTIEWWCNVPGHHGLGMKGTITVV